MITDFKSWMLLYHAVDVFKSVMLYKFCHFDKICSDLIAILIFLNNHSQSLVT